MSLRSSHGLDFPEGPAPSTPRRPADSSWLAECEGGESGRAAAKSRIWPFTSVDGWGGGKGLSPATALPLTPRPALKGRVTERSQGRKRCFHCPRLLSPVLRGSLPRRSAGSHGEGAHHRAARGRRRGAPTRPARGQSRCPSACPARAVGAVPEPPPVSEGPSTSGLMPPRVSPCGQEPQAKRRAGRGGGAKRQDETCPPCVWSSVL